MIVVSACLCGVNCKYSGKNNLNEDVLNLVRDGKAILICPEQLGGLETPRFPCEIINGTGFDVLNGNAKVINKNGDDLTKNFINGAKEALNIAKIVGANMAILKANSPSCGFGNIYDGNFNGNKINGNGVTAELFMQNNIKIINENQINIKNKY